MMKSLPSHPTNRDFRDDIPCSFTTDEAIDHRPTPGPRTPGRAEIDTAVLAR